MSCRLDSWLVGPADLAALVRDVRETDQVSVAFVLLGTWASNGADPAAVPAVLDGGLSQFWFVASPLGCPPAVCVWHDYSLLDQSI